MKTAISLPDDLFLAAERQAKRTRKSRSQLYAEALTEYLARHAPDEVTEAMNRVVERLDEPRPDPLLVAAARRVFERAEWSRSGGVRSGGLSCRSPPGLAPGFADRWSWFRAHP